MFIHVSYLVPSLSHITNESKSLRFTYHVYFGYVLFGGVGQLVPKHTHTVPKLVDHTSIHYPRGGGGGGGHLDI